MREEIKQIHPNNNFKYCNMKNHDATYILILSILDDIFEIETNNVNKYNNIGFS